MNKITLSATIFLIIISIFILWQFMLINSMKASPISCGGDWSYNVKCPMGTTCKSLRQGYLLGGLCTPWIDISKP